VAYGVYKSVLTVNNIILKTNNAIKAISTAYTYANALATNTASMATLGFTRNMLRATLTMIRFATVGVFQAIKGVGAMVLSLITGGKASATFAAISKVSFASFATSARVAARAVSVAIMNIPILGWIAAALAALIAFTVKLRELGASWVQIIAAVFFGLPGMVALYFYKSSVAVRAGLDGMIQAAREIFSGLGTFMTNVFEGILIMIKGVFDPRNWFDENYYEIEGHKMHLDKDILVKRNKIYSPDKCVFVPAFINATFTKNNVGRGDLPIGVVKRGKKYFASCSNNNQKRRYLGMFDNPEEAFYAYKDAKETHIKNTAEQYKHKIPNKLYEALMRYEVDIDD
jgi:hypothetical protein